MIWTRVSKALVPVDLSRLDRSQLAWVLGLHDVERINSSSSVSRNASYAVQTSQDTTVERSWCE